MTHHPSCPNIPVLPSIFWRSFPENTPLYVYPMPGACMALKPSFSRMEAALARGCLLWGCSICRVTPPTSILVFHASFPLPILGLPPSQKSSTFNVSAIDRTGRLWECKPLRQCSDPQLCQQSIPTPPFTPRLAGSSPGERGVSEALCEVIGHKADERLGSAVGPPPVLPPSP